MDRKTAAAMARSRLDRDVAYVKKRFAEGDWREVSRIAIGLGGEVISILYSGALYPFAWVGEDLPPGSTVLPESDTRPVVLLHGWFHNRTGCALMAKRLRAEGRAHVFALDLPTTTASVQRLSGILDEKIARVCALTGARKVDVVAHSLGGLVARYWMQHDGGAKRLKNLVTLGAPIKGTALAAFIPVGTGKAINIGSDIVRSLEAPPPKGVRVTSILSEMDWLILPPHDAEGSGEEEVRVRYQGHLSLLYSKRVFHEIARALA